MYETTPRWTYIFILLSLVGFVLQYVTSSWVYLAFFPALVLEYPWMFITSIFLHADLSHLFFNMMALFFFGTYLERMIGRKSFLVLFLVSGVIGNLGYLFTASDPLTPAIGASGAIYGVVGTLAVLAPLMMIFIYGIIPLPMFITAILWTLLDLVGLFTPSGIAHGAHLGGMVVGVIYGLYLRYPLITRRVTFG
ncbi:MAG TPA: rhomboid family intramembrane serine protease [Nitrososphaerales archaeon]